MLDAGKDLAEVLQTLEVSEQACYHWRNQYGGMKAPETKRLKELEQENARLKKLDHQGVVATGHRTDLIACPMWLIVQIPRPACEVLDTFDRLHQTINI